MDEITILKRKNRELENYLRALTETVANCLACLDSVMSQPERRERGQKIAHITNVLEKANDSAMHFGLQLGFRKMDNIKRRVRRRGAEIQVMDLLSTE